MINDNLLTGARTALMIASAVPGILPLSIAKWGILLIDAAAAGDKAFENMMDVTENIERHAKNGTNPSDDEWAKLDERRQALSQQMRQVQLPPL